MAVRRHEVLGPDEHEAADGGGEGDHRADEKDLVEPVDEADAGRRADGLNRVRRQALSAPDPEPGPFPIPAAIWWA